MILAFSIVTVLATAIACRVVPIWLSPAGAGVDHWFWKSYIEEYRRNRRFPPVLTQYILDEKQWYPPVFPLLMAALPVRVFERSQRGIAIAIDLLRLCLLIAVAIWQSDGSAMVVMIAGLFYATTPIQVSYNVQLNPRGLAALMLDGVLMLLLLQIDNGGPVWVWGVITALTGLILLTHKMTTQLFWFMMLGTGALYTDWRLLALIPGSITAAMLMSRGFYWQVLKAHWDIVSFWNRNWRWVGADLIRESPIYGDGTYERSEKLHRSGVHGVVWSWLVLVGFNPAAWIACLLTYERLTGFPILIYPTFLLVWLLLPCLFALVTTFVPMFRCVGAGYLYIYNTSLIASLMLALTYRYTRAPEFSTPFVVLALVLNIASVLLYYVQFQRNKRGRVHGGLDQTIEALCQMPRGVVMCIPTNWYEVVAYRSGHPVLWGAHGYGFRKIEPTFPRFLISVTEILQRYDVRYLLTMEGMLTPAVMAELPECRVVQHGEYRLYCFQEQAAMKAESEVVSRVTHVAGAS